MKFVSAISCILSLVLLIQCHAKSVYSDSLDAHGSDYTNPFFGGSGDDGSGSISLWDDEGGDYDDGLQGSGSGEVDMEIEEIVSVGIKETVIEKANEEEGVLVEEDVIENILTVEIEEIGPSEADEEEILEEIEDIVQEADILLEEIEEVNIQKDILKDRSNEIPTGHKSIQAQHEDKEQSKSSGGTNRLVFFISSGILMLSVFLLLILLVVALVRKRNEGEYNAIGKEKKISIISSNSTKSNGFLL